MLVSLSDMKNYLGIPSGNTTHDAFLTQQINIISEAIENYCQRKFNQTTYVQTFYKDEMLNRDKVLDTLQLYHFPVTSITTLKEIWEETSVETTLAPTDYRVNIPVGWVMRKKYLPFFAEGDKIEVTYVAGFSVIPFTIQNAVYGLVKERYNKHTSGIDLDFGSDIQSISIPGTISVAYDYSLQNNERKTAFGAILGNYVNTLDYFRSERPLIGSVRLEYVTP